MNGARRIGSTALGAAIAAALALGLGLLLVPEGSASAAPSPEFTLEYTGLQTGVPQTETGGFTLDRDAQLVLFEWLQQTGLFAPDRATLDVDVCDSGDTCLDPRTFAGPVMLAAGPVTVSVTVTLTTPADNGESGSLSGRLSFTADDALAASGSTWAPWIAAGIAAVSVGALVLALTRRHDQVAFHSSR